MGPILTLPVGFTIFSVIVVAVYMILSEVFWRKMDHLPEDEEPWSEDRPFVMQEDH